MVRVRVARGSRDWHPGTRTVRAVYWIVFSLAALSGPRFSAAQSEFEAARGPDARNQLIREIAAEARLFEEQFSLLKKVVRLVRPSVVHIEAEKAEKSRENSRKSVEEAGSGAIIEHRGQYYVLTNRHVIRNAPISKIDIRLADGRVFHPKRVWSDSGTDVAVMSIDAPSVAPCLLGNSDAVEIGDFALAVGSPFGLSHSVTYGIISATGRRNLQLGDEGVQYQNFLQTDAAINPGNSGGPLLNVRGEVIGINTAIASSSGGSEGIGFSIPINMAMAVVQQLIDKGTVSRAYLGVDLKSKFGPVEAAKLGLPTPQGALISGIHGGTPAAEADMRIGDVVLQFDGVTIEDDSHLMQVVGLTPVGKSVTVVVLRQAKPVRLSVTVADRQRLNSPPANTPPANPR